MLASCRDGLSGPFPELVQVLKEGWEKGLKMLHVLGVYVVEILGLSPTVRT